MRTMHDWSYVPTPARHPMFTVTFTLALTTIFMVANYVIAQSEEHSQKTEAMCGGNSCRVKSKYHVCSSSRGKGVGRGTGYAPGIQRAIPEVILDGQTERRQDRQKNW